MGSNVLIPTLFSFTPHTVYVHSLILGSLTGQLNLCNYKSETLSLPLSARYTLSPKISRFTQKCLSTVSIENKFIFTLLNISYHTIWLKSIEPLGIEPDAFAFWASTLTTRPQRLTVQSFVSRSLHPSDSLCNCTLQPSIFKVRPISWTLQCHLPLRWYTLHGTVTIYMRPKYF